MYDENVGLYAKPKASEKQKKSCMLNPMGFFFCMLNPGGALPRQGNAPGTISMDIIHGYYPWITSMDNIHGYYLWIISMDNIHGYYPWILSLDIIHG